MSQTPDPSKNSNRFNDSSNTGSDSSVHQDNNSSNSPYDQYQYYSDPQRQSPVSDPAYQQDYQYRKRLGRPPKKVKEKSMTPRSPVMPSDSTGISQVKMNDSDHMQINQMQACQFQIPIISPSAQLPTQIGLNSNDYTMAANHPSIPLPGIHPILPVQQPQTNIIPQVMYPNSKLSMNQLKVQFIAAAQNQLVTFDNESLDFLLKLFDISNQNQSKQQKIESFTTFISSIMYSVPQNLNEFIFFLLQQFSNKISSSFYQQLANPPVPFVFQQLADQKIIYKFLPLNVNKNIEIPLNKSISGEYAIIATIIPPSPQLSTCSIVVNGQNCNPANFGEETEKIYYLISSMSKTQELKNSITVRLNQKMFHHFGWIVFIYVVPAQKSRIERYAGINQPIRGVRTELCNSGCLFDFYDVIKKIYNFGYSICPTCHQNIYLTKLVLVRQHLRQFTNLDQIANAFSYQSDSSVIEHYNYFTREIFINGIDNEEEEDKKDASTEKNPENDDDFDPDKFIEDVENEYSTVMTSFTHF